MTGLRLRRGLAPAAMSALKFSRTVRLPSPDFIGVRCSGLSLLFMTLELFLNESAPYLIGLPNRAQVAFRLGESNALTQHSIKKHERRDALVGGAMNKHGPLIEGLHHSTERSEIL